MEFETLQYELEDCYKMAIANPETFEIPTAKDLNELQITDYVKLIFKQSGHNNERMWVRLTYIDGPTFFGTLDNDPYILTNVKHGDMIKFRARHIAGILK